MPSLIVPRHAAAEEGRVEDAARKPYHVSVHRTVQQQPGDQMNDTALRNQLVELLKGDHAHTSFDAAVRDFPFPMAGRRIEGLPYTAWQILEHLRIAQWDILDFSRNPGYIYIKWPDDYWPKDEAPANASAWEKCLAAFRSDLKAMQELVANPATDLFAKIPWGEGQTILREAIVLGNHNSYHIGQLVLLRRLLGTWRG